MESATYFDLELMFWAIAFAVIVTVNAIKGVNDDEK